MTRPTLRKSTRNQTKIVDEEQIKKKKKNEVENDRDEEEVEGVEKEIEDEEDEEAEEENKEIKWTDNFAKELHKPVRFKFKKRRVYSPGPNSIWAADLADLSKYSRSNKGYKYLLLVIDIFTKYGYIRPLKNKTGVVTTQAFKDIFQKSKTSPKKLWVDKGTEFYNKNLKTLLEEYKVKMYSTENELKSSVVERWVRTMKTIMWRYFTAARTRVYISKLDEIVEK